MDFECLTGGLSHANRTSYSGSKLTFNTENIFIDAKSDGGGGGITTNKTIDLTNFKNIKARGITTEIDNSGSRGRILAVTKNNKWGSTWYPESNITYIDSKLETKETILEIDISSLNDSYYIINGFNQSKGNIYEIWLEK